MSKIWCPYTNKELEESETSPEHIIPLSLGGHNKFIIPVEKDFNSKVGSQIDGAYCNDHLVKIRRNRLDARGHSKKKPIPIVKKGTREENDQIVQINLDIDNKDIELFDPKSKKTFSAKGGESLKMSFKMDIEIHVRLAAKIALSAAYFIFGDLFRKNVKHEDLRLLMKESSKLTPEEKSSIETRIYHIYSAVNERDKEDLEIDKMLCKALKGSLVMFGLGPKNFVVTVGILGEYVATLNIPAKIDGFPREGKFDLGHVVLISNGKLQRYSCRDYMKVVHEHISSVKNGPSDKNKKD